MECMRQQGCGRNSGERGGRDDSGELVFFLKEREPTGSTPHYSSAAAGGYKGQPPRPALLTMVLCANSVVVLSPVGGLVSWAPPPPGLVDDVLVREQRRDALSGARVGQLGPPPPPPR